MITVTLPAPPSVNEAWANVPGKGRVKTRRYTDWISNATWKLQLQLKEQETQRIAGRCIVVIGVERHSQTADIDNRVKPLLDLLVSQNVIDDDRHVDGVAIAWNPPGSNLAHLTIVPTADGLGLLYHLAGSMGAFGGWFLTAPGVDEDGTIIE